jgi:hypothetical protein
MRMTSANEADLKLMAMCEALAEKAYAEMYETRYPTGCYADLKDHFTDAIAAAQRAGKPDEVKRLEARLEHCKQVYRRQFSSF